MIYIARDPKDVCVSAYHHMTSLAHFNFTSSFDDFVAMFAAGNVESGSWWSHVAPWWGLRHSPRVLFLTYEALESDLECCVRQISLFIGLGLLNNDIVDAVVAQSAFEAMKDDPR